MVGDFGLGAKVKDGGDAVVVGKRLEAGKIDLGGVGRAEQDVTWDRDGRRNVAEIGEGGDGDEGWRGWIGSWRGKA